MESWSQDEETTVVEDTDTFAVAVSTAAVAADDVATAAVDVDVATTVAETDSECPDKEEL